MVLTLAQRLNIERKKREARRKMLNAVDVISFIRVPDFIIDSFFDKSSYKKRLIVASFCVLNGIPFSISQKLIKWIPFESVNIIKVKDLMENYLILPLYRSRYYSYDVTTSCVRFLDGSVRLYGKKIN